MTSAASTTKHPRAKKAKGEVRDRYEQNLSELLSYAQRVIAGVAPDDGLQGDLVQDAVCRVIGFAEPGSPVRALSLRAITSMIAANALTLQMMRRPRWPDPAANETLVT